MQEVKAAEDSVWSVAGVADDEYPHFSGMEPGPLLGSRDERHPWTESQLFKKFFTPRLMKWLVEHTNSYGSEKFKDKWEDVDSRRMFSFFGILIFLGIYPSPSFKDLWNTDFELCGRPGIANVMSRTQFEMILRGFHVEDDFVEEKNMASERTHKPHRSRQMPPRLCEHPQNTSRNTFHQTRRLCSPHNQRGVPPPSLETCSKIVW